MSNEIAFHNVNETDTIYAVVKGWADRSKIINTTSKALVTLVAANWASYDIAMAVSVATSGDYLADMPDIAAGRYWIEIHLQAAGAVAIGDLVIGAYSYDWTGTAAAPAAVAADGWNALGVTTLRDSLLDQYGNRVVNPVRQKGIIEGCIVQALKRVYAALPRQEQVVTLDTTGSTAYIQLPSNYAGKYRAPKGGLYLEDSESSRIFWRPALAWPDLEARYTAEGTPHVWTIRHRTISSVPVPVLELLPVPDQTWTIRGLRLSVNAPDVEYGTAGASDDYSYLPKQFDMLLEAEARYRLVCGSGWLKAGEPDVRVQEMREVRTARNIDWDHAETLFDELRETMDERREDVMELAQQLESSDAILLDEEDLTRRLAAS